MGLRITKTFFTSFYIEEFHCTHKIGYLKKTIILRLSFTKFDVIEMR